MKRSDKKAGGLYLPPECEVLRVEVGTSVLISSPVTWENNIKDPTWDTDGDFGLE